jgi:hypothetical protein
LGPAPVHVNGAQLAMGAAEGGSMQAFLAFFAAALFLSALAPRARAEIRPDVPSAYRLPPAGPLPSPLAPLREEPAYARRSFELALGPNAGLIGCSGAAPASVAESDPCRELSPAFGLEAQGLWRLSGHWALGARLEYTHFSWDARLALGQPASGGTGRWPFLGLEGRGYLFDEGAFDPYLGAALGWGLLSMEFREGAEELALRRESLATAISAGASWWVSSRMRVGPNLTFSWQPFGGVERCERGVCLDGSAFGRVPNRALRLGITVTFGAGDEL